MNLKRFSLAALLVFIIIQLTDFIFHNIIQADTYQALQHVWRKDMMDKMWLMFIVAINFSIIFVYIYVKGFAANGLRGGLIYGLVMSFAHPFIAALSQYAIYPLPFALVVQWYIFGIIQLVLCGIAVSFVYKKVPANN